MCQVAALQLFNLCFGLFDGHGFGIIDEQRDDLHLVDICLPELPCEFRIFADRLAVLTQLRQPDAKTLQSSRLFFVFLLGKPYLLPVEQLLYARNTWY